jgi:hypothetical protein
MQALGVLTDEEALETAIAQLQDKVNQYKIEMDDQPSFVAHTHLSYYQAQLRILMAVENRLDKYSKMTGNLGVLYPAEVDLARSIVGMNNA